MAQLSFDASQVAPNAGTPDPVPDGWYNVMIDQSEMKPTKDGAGTYLELRFNVIDGQYANRKLFARLNLRNNNPVAQEIAYGELSAICHSTGVMQLQDSQQLHGIPLKVKAKVRPAKDGYDASNDLSGYKNINEQTGDAPSGGGGAPAGFGNPAPQNNAPQNAAPQNAGQQPWQQQPAQQPAQQANPQGGQQQPWQQQPSQQPEQQPQQGAQQQGAAQQPWQQPNNQQPAQEQPQQQQPQQPPQQQPNNQPQNNAGNGMPPWAQGQ